MKDKYVWWGILGIGVAAFFYFLSRQNQSATTSNIQVPYLVPTTGASPSASESLSTQPNIVGSSSNSQIPNFTNPYMVASNPMEAPGTWGFMPNLQVNPSQSPTNNVGLAFSPSTNPFLTNSISSAQSPTHV